MHQKSKPAAVATATGWNSVDFTEHDTIPPKPVDEIGQGANARFASWKFNLLDALVVDPRLIHADFRVAFVVLQCMNGKTRATFPSHEVIAERACMSVRNVELCLGRLRQAGWVSWQRGNRQLANNYVFNTTNVTPMLDRRISLDEGRRERRKERAEAKVASRQILLTRRTLPLPTRSRLPVPTGSRLPTNTPTQHLKGRPEEDWAWEEVDDF